MNYRARPTLGIRILAFIIWIVLSVALMYVMRLIFELRRRGYTYSCVALCFAILIVPVVGFVAYRMVRRARYIPPGHCQKCGYDLTKNESGVCPECGVAIPASAVKTPRCSP